MRPSPPLATTLLLRDCWIGWADRLAILPDDAWQTPTRCASWDVAALAAHVAPDPVLLEALAPIDAEAPVATAADLLRIFNAPGGAAHAMADAVAAQAREKAAGLAQDELPDRFRRSAERLEAATLPDDAAVPYPVVGAVTVAALVDVQLVEAVVHHQDLRAAVGGPTLPDEAVHRVVGILAAVAEPAAFIDAATGRGPIDAALPVMR